MKKVIFTQDLDAIEQKLVDRDLASALSMVPLDSVLATDVPTEKLAAVFGVALSLASVQPETFPQLRPFLDWCLNCGADPFDLSDRSSSSVTRYAEACEFAALTNTRPEDAVVVRWCLQSKCSMEWQEPSLDDQVEYDLMLGWLMSHKGKGLGSLPQIENARCGQIDWNRSWANGKTTLLIAIEEAIDAGDFQKDFSGQNRYATEWVEAFRGLRRLAKEVPADSSDVAALFWVSQAWALTSEQSFHNLASKTGDRVPSKEEKTAQSALNMLLKELASRWPKAYRARFDPDGPWSIWLRQRASTSHEILWGRIAGVAGALETWRQVSQQDYRSAATEAGLPLDSALGTALHRQLQVAEIATPVLESLPWEDGSPMRRSCSSNTLLGQAWSAFTRGLNHLSPTARQKLLEHPGIYGLALPGLVIAGGGRPDRDAVLMGLLLSPRLPQSRAWEEATTSDSLTEPCRRAIRSARLEHSLPVATVGIKGPRF